MNALGGLVDEADELAADGDSDGEEVGLGGGAEDAEGRPRPTLRLPLHEAAEEGRPANPHS